MKNDLEKRGPFLIGKGGAYEVVRRGGPLRYEGKFRRIRGRKENIIG